MTSLNPLSAGMGSLPLPTLGTLCILAVIGIHTLDGPAKALCVLGGLVFGTLALWMAFKTEEE